MGKGTARQGDKNFLVRLAISDRIIREDLNVIRWRKAWGNEQEIHRDIRESFLSREKAVQRLWGGVFKKNQESRVRGKEIRDEERTDY